MARGGKSNHQKEDITKCKFCPLISAFFAFMVLNRCVKIFAINSFMSNIRLQAVSFGTTPKSEQPQGGDTFQKGRKPEEFYILSKLAHAGQVERIWELLKTPEYDTKALGQLLLMQDKNGRTPLHKAVRGAGFETAVMNYKPGEIEEILKNNTNLRMKRNIEEVNAIRRNVKKPPHYMSTIWIMIEPFKDKPEALKKILTMRDCD